MSDLNKKVNILNLYCLTTFLLGVVLFFFGFFPVSYERISHNDTGIERPTNLNGIELIPPKRQYPQTTLMIVDALRDDFANIIRMPFAIESACNQLKLEANIPTVTMPRIKSIVSGTLSNFIDIVLNVGYTEQLHDSIIHRLNKRGDLVTFGGDHTWLKLFPKEFHRKEANSDSFFVGDFYEGDINVTRTLEREHAKDDWTLLILHYLGLDHIGHVEGSDSLKIPGKLKEMDDAISKMYQNVNKTKQLILVTSDHGMRNGGGHGGNSPEEIHVPLLVLKSDCNKKREQMFEYNQIDLTPTLAILLSVEIPRDSIGVLISELLEDHDLNDQLYAYYYNALHLMNKADYNLNSDSSVNNDYLTWFEDANNAFREFLNTQRLQGVKSRFLFEKAKLNYIRVSREISNNLSQSLVNFDYVLIAIGLGLTTLIIIYTVLLLFFAKPMLLAQSATSKVSHVMFALVVAVALNIFLVYIAGGNDRSRLYSVLLTIPVALGVYTFLFIVRTVLPLIFMPGKQMHAMTLSFPLPLMACLVYHTLSLTSSSFIEEEHQTWYYLGATIFIGLFSRIFYNILNRADNRKISLSERMRAAVWRLRYFILVLVSVGLLRKLNQTGDKWRHLKDFGDFLNQNNNKVLLSLFLIIGLFLLIAQLWRHSSVSVRSACILASCCVYIYRGLNKSVIFFNGDSILTNIFIIIFWITIAFINLSSYQTVLRKRKTYGYEPKANLIQLLRTNLICTQLICALLHRPHNVILLPAQIFILEQAYKCCDMRIVSNNDKSARSQSYKLISKALITIITAKMFYFYQGNSNSLATIDLNPGYVGQSSYNPILVVCFVTLNTYGAYINSFQYLLLHLFSLQMQSLPVRHEKEEISNRMLVITTEEDLQLVIIVYSAATMLPLAMYLGLLVIFRYHLFIYSVFAPKAFYECFSFIVFYINFIITNLYFRLF